MIISQTIVDQTWRDVSEMSAAKAEREVVRLTKRQPDLFTFVATWTQDLSRDAAELALYLFYTIYRMFEQGAPRKLRRIHSREIIQCYEANESLLEKLEGADERFLERAAMVQSSRQPHVIGSVVEALMEAPTWDSPLTIDDNEFGLVFLTLKTIIDTLDDSVSLRN